MALRPSILRSKALRSLGWHLVGAAGFSVLTPLLAVGCSRPPPETTPEGTVRLWLERMEEGTPKATREAFELLGPDARANLQERAERATEVEGRLVSPHEMIAAGFFGLRFRPKGIEGTVAGDVAVVEVTGVDPHDRAALRCRRLGNVWRIEPDFPPPPVPIRWDAGF